MEDVERLKLAHLAMNTSIFPAMLASSGASQEMKTVFIELLCKKRFCCKDICNFRFLLLSGLQKWTDLQSSCDPRCQIQPFAPDNAFINL